MHNVKRIREIAPGDLVFYSGRWLTVADSAAWSERCQRITFTNGSAASFVVAPGAIMSCRDRDASRPMSIRDYVAIRDARNARKARADAIGWRDRAIALATERTRPSLPLLRSGDMTPGRLFRFEYSRVRCEWTEQSERADAAMGDPNP